MVIVEEVEGSSRAVRRSDFKVRRADARLQKLKDYRTKRPGGKDVKYIDSQGNEKLRRRRYRPRTQSQRRRKFYSTNKKGREGSGIVQARINTFVKTMLNRIKTDVGDTGTHWSNDKDDAGNDVTRFQTSKLFKEHLGLYMSELQRVIYNDAAIRARKTEEDFKTDAPVCVQPWHVTAAWAARLRAATAGSRSYTNQEGGPDVSTNETQSGKQSRARLLSTESQRKAVKAVSNISRAPTDVAEMIDRIVKQQACHAVQNAMIHVHANGRVKLKRNDLIRAVKVVGTFPDIITAL